MYGGGVLGPKILYAGSVFTHLRGAVLCWISSRALFLLRLKVVGESQEGRNAKWPPTATGILSRCALSHYFFSQMALQSAMSHFFLDLWVEFWKVNFGRWIPWGWIFQGASVAGKTGLKNSTQEFGSKIRASKFRFPEFGPKFGFRRCKIPCAEIYPWHYSFQDLEGCRRRIALHPEKDPVAPTFSALKGGVALQIPPWRCRGTRGCRSYTVACRATMGHLGATAWRF